MAFSYTKSYYLIYPLVVSVDYIVYYILFSSSWRLFSISPRSSGDSGFILCLWYLCWSVLLAVFVRSQIHRDKRSERPCLWAWRWAQVLPQDTWRTNRWFWWWWCLLAVFFSAPRAPLPHASVQPRDDNDSGDGGEEGWGQTWDAQWRHLASYQLQPLRHAHNQNILCLIWMFSSYLTVFPIKRNTNYDLTWVKSKIRFS